MAALNDWRYFKSISLYIIFHYKYSFFSIYTKSYSLDISHSHTSRYVVIFLIFTAAKILLIYLFLYFWIGDIIFFSISVCILNMNVYIQICAYLCIYTLIDIQNEKRINTEKNLLIDSLLETQFLLSFPLL